MIKFRSLWIALLLLMMIISAALPAAAQVPGQSPAADDPLLGLWTSETTFGPALHGELTVTREGSSWRATLASAESRFKLAGGTLHFAFAGDLGQFRGALTDNGR